jgi:hypothetical protein
MCSVKYLWVRLQVFLRRVVPQNSSMEADKFFSVEPGVPPL